jgi:PAS domain S-box-containing protein
MTTEDLAAQGTEPQDDLVDRLRKSEELYARVFLRNPVAMSVTNSATGRFTQINAAFAALLGYSRSELIGRSSEELGLWPDRSRRDEIGARLSSGDELSLIPGRVRAKDGTETSVVIGFRLLDIDHSPSVLSVLVPMPGGDGPVSL